MNNQENGNYNYAKRKYIGYRGNWYDVTNFIERHPGGDVIEKFIGYDATHVIETAHRHDVLAKRKPARRIDERDKNGHRYPPNTYKPSKFGSQMLELHMKLKKNGYYDNSIGWFVRKMSLVFFIHMMLFFLVTNYGSSFPMQCFTSFLLAAFWQQSGMLMHDLMHSQAFQNRKIDEVLGIYFGTFCFGISSRQWKYEHSHHHALTNTVDYQTGFVDPQADEEPWAQNEKLFPFKQGKLYAICIKIQYITFLPLCMFVGRIGIMIDSMRTERRKDVWAALILHWIWVALLLSFFPTWKVRLLVYYGGSVGEGILHIQLLMNHYSKPFYHKRDMHEQDFFRTMVDANINIICPVWMDWFHGGLNFHIEHHCFPRLPRNRLREVSPMIKKICEENDVHFDECSFTYALIRTLSHLKSVSELYKAMKTM